MENKIKSIVLQEIHKLYEYSIEDKFLSSYESAEEYAYDNIGDVAEAFDEYKEKPDDIRAEYSYNQYVERIELYVDKYNELKNENTITIYRLVKLDSISDLDLNDIGMHWSFEKDGVGDYGGHHPKQSYYKDPKSYVLTGYANPDDIDWIYGFNSFIWYGEEQWECALNTGAEVKIVEINDEELNPPLTAHVGQH
jgi:hypothetical protein